MMKRFCIVATVILCLAGVSEAETFSGTVNVVLANSNGIVVLTDSLLTGERNGVQVRLPGQKLFVLDDKTVGTLAGLAATRSVDFQDVLSGQPRSSAVTPKSCILHRDRSSLSATRRPD
jgi:hypothetical protein